MGVGRSGDRAKAGKWHEHQGEARAGTVLLCAHLGNVCSTLGGRLTFLTLSDFLVDAQKFLTFHFLFLLPYPSSCQSRDHCFTSHYGTARSPRLAPLTSGLGSEGGANLGRKVLWPLPAIVESLQKKKLYNVRDQKSQGCDRVLRCSWVLAGVCALRENNFSSLRIVLQCACHQRTG